MQAEEFLGRYVVLHDGPLDGLADGEGEIGVGGGIYDDTDLRHDPPHEEFINDAVARFVQEDHVAARRDVGGHLRIQMPDLRAAVNVVQRAAHEMLTDVVQLIGGEREGAFDVLVQVDGETAVHGEHVEGIIAEGGTGEELLGELHGLSGVA